MGDVKPWEPVMYLESRPGAWPMWRPFRQVACDWMVSNWPFHITLANGQRIIVRALSEERKAARRVRREGE